MLRVLGVGPRITARIGGLGWNSVILTQPGAEVDQLATLAAERAKRIVPGARHLAAAGTA